MTRKKKKFTNLELGEPKSMKKNLKRLGNRIAFSFPYSTTSNNSSLVNRGTEK
ncbi:hypothetical protein LC605_31455 [Nostoc sp. CHAB 5836]|uniref:hypothetical protein n=1 Tax=Nostoc sp. CHAB 5836 TaxID=2780404 RepID=UPI001E5647C2|nr:hypothetical protein [Nostoc sp. CHAB 5836]MCC5619490.1 hypothetical protein [Nostoc sp. CHAB 5836]